MGDIAGEGDPNFLSRHFYLLADPSAIHLDHLHVDIASQIDGGSTVSNVITVGAMLGTGPDIGIVAVADIGLAAAPRSPLGGSTSSGTGGNFSHSLAHAASEAANFGPTNAPGADAFSLNLGGLDDHALGIGTNISTGFTDDSQPRLNASGIVSAAGDPVTVSFGNTFNTDHAGQNASGATPPAQSTADLRDLGINHQGLSISGNPFDNTNAGSQLVSNDIAAGSVNPSADVAINHAIAAGASTNAKGAMQGGWSIQADNFQLEDPAGGITQQKINNFTAFIDAFKADGVNTITLNNVVPVDPSTGNIESALTTPDRWGSSIGPVTPQYMVAFTNIAEAAGLHVIWKPSFVLDNGLDQNVNDYTTGPTFYPSGTTFSVPNFLSNVQTFWAQWAPIAQANGVSMLVLGAEQGKFAGPQYDSSWDSIIHTARSTFSGQLTYETEAFSPVQPPAYQTDFWSLLDVIGVEDYLPIGNGTANTPYSQAYHNIFNSQVFGLTSTGPNYDIPGILYNLHSTYTKPIFLTEFGTESVDGAMNNPAVPAGTAPNANNAEQSDYYKANFDVLENYNWVAGMNIFDTESEGQSFVASSQPGNWQATNFPWLGKPTEGVIANYWSDGASPPPIDASGALNTNGAFAGTSASPNILVGGFQNDTFYNLGGVYQISGGGGVDSVDYTAGSTGFTLTATSDGLVVADKINAEGTGTLHLVDGFNQVGADAMQLVFTDRTITAVIPGSTYETVALLYQGALGRTPDAGGLGGWNAIAAALPASAQALGPYALSDVSGNYNTTLSIAAGFTNSPEFIAKYGSLTNVQFVTQLYANILDRGPDTVGFNGWMNQLGSGQSREHVLVGFADSAEAISNAANGFIGTSGTHAAWLFLA